jgi:hypothetical protein
MALTIKHNLARLQRASLYFLSAPLLFRKQFSALIDICQHQFEHPSNNFVPWHLHINGHLVQFRDGRVIEPDRHYTRIHVTFFREVILTIV